MPPVFAPSLAEFRNKCFCMCDEFAIQPSDVGVLKLDYFSGAFTWFGSDLVLINYRFGEANFQPLSFPLECERYDRVEVDTVHSSTFTQTADAGGAIGSYNKSETVHSLTRVESATLVNSATMSPLSDDLNYIYTLGNPPPDYTLSIESTTSKYTRAAYNFQFDIFTGSFSSDVYVEQELHQTTTSTGPNSFTVHKWGKNYAINSSSGTDVVEEIGSFVRRETHTGGYLFVRTNNPDQGELARVQPTVTVTENTSVGNAPLHTAITGIGGNATILNIASTNIIHNSELYHFNRTNSKNQSDPIPGGVETEVISTTSNIKFLRTVPNKAQLTYTYTLAQTQGNTEFKVQANSLANFTGVATQYQELTWQLETSPPTLEYRSPIYDLPIQITTCLSFTPATYNGTPINISVQRH